MNNRKVNLGVDPISACFKYYLLPAITGMIIKSVYILVDLIFIGKSLGSDALAAVNLIIPYFALIFAIATAVGVGGSALMAICMGKNNVEESRLLFQQSFVFTGIIMLILTVVTLFNMDFITELFGAKGDLAVLAKDYLKVLVIFITPYGLGWTMSGFIRNDGNPTLVMIALVTSALINIFLDWLFLFPLDWGMKGAALATGISQIAIILILSLHFRYKECQLVFRIVRPKWHHIKGILKNGMPTFITEFTLSIMILIANSVLLHLGGTTFIAAYSISLNYTWTFILLIYGVGQASQPLISFNYGAQLPLRVKETLWYAFRLIVPFSILSTILTMIFARSIVQFFLKDPSDSLLDVSAYALQLYSLAFLPLSLSLIVSALYQSIAKSNYAVFISVLRGFLFPLMGLWLLPILFSKNAVWFNLIVSEVFTMLISIRILARYFELNTRTSDN